MNNADKHNTFSDSEVRDFLGKNIGHYYPGEVEGVERRIKQLQEEMKKLEEEFENAKAGSALFALAKSQGWEFHDVSDEIVDYNSKTYFPFVGTEDEKKDLVL